MDPVPLHTLELRMMVHLHTRIRGHRVIGDELRLRGEDGNMHVDDHTPEPIIDEHGADGHRHLNGLDGNSAELHLVRVRGFLKLDPEIHAFQSLVTREDPPFPMCVPLWDAQVPADRARPVFDDAMRAYSDAAPPGTLAVAAQLSYNLTGRVLHRSRLEKLFRCCLAGLGPDGGGYMGGIGLQSGGMFLCHYGP